VTAQVSGEARVEAVRVLRKLRGRRLGLRLVIGVGLPTALAAFYFGLLASPQYESVTSFTIQSADSPGGASPLQALMASVPGTSSRDPMVVQQFIESRDMVDLLVRDHQLREHYSDTQYDWLSRLGADATVDEVHEYYLDHVHIDLDDHAGTVTLHVRAFSPEQAETFGQAILDASERMVNQLSERARTDRIRYAEEHVATATERLTAARAALVELQAAGAELNPQASATAVLGIRSHLEGELAIARAELSTLSATLQPGAPMVIEQRRRVAALQRQVDEQTQRLAGDSEGLSAAIARFEPVYVEKELAERLYEAALGSLEIARVDAGRQHRYVVRISGPSRPEAPSHPILWREVLTVLVVSFALLGIGTLVIASVREHANV
jgi:capsular polysaccharide transport system permease protein